MNDEGARYDSGFDDSGPFADTPPPGGVSLDSALREFGPAAIEDLIPRLRALADVLDHAHAAGFVHGRLHPSKVLVTDDGTYVMGRRVPASGPLTPEADQYALAAMAYEWMFGRPIAGPANRPVDVRSIPGVDRAALSGAFTRALSPEPSRRFGSCADFVDALAATITPSLPLMAVDDEDDPVGPFMPEEPAAVVPIVAAESVPDLSFNADASNVAAAEPDLDAMNPVALPPEPVPAWQPSATEIPDKPSNRFSGVALIFAAIVGMVAGFAAGYMARPRALQSGPPAEIASAGTDNDLRTTAPSAPPPAREARKAPTPAPKASASARNESDELRRDRPEAPLAPARIGRLLVRSTPSGASVEVDGVARGVTPLALRDLDLGARAISVTRRGYVPEERRIVLTKARPSQSVEVRMSAQAAAASPRPSTPASLGKPSASAAAGGSASAKASARQAGATGALAIESRPAGASVLLNGKPSGTTPMMINELAPGDYRVTLSLSGYREFATTVRVVAGERARAAARLTEQEQE